ncbi:MAG: hypothetical protein WC604_04045 [Candidatus Gracilibacteria bacterium]
MLSVKSLGLAAALSLLPACEKPAEQPKQEVVSAECERFRAALGMEDVVEQMAAKPGSWKVFPPDIAEATWKKFHAEAIAALEEVEDQGACLRKIKGEK